MNPTFAIEGAKLVSARDVPVGSLFCLVREKRVCGLCMRVRFEKTQLFLSLDGDHRFNLDEIASTHYGLQVEAGSLRFRLGDPRTDESEEPEEGLLIISETGAFMTVRLDGLGNTYQILLLNLSDGILQREYPPAYCALENWQMISRAANGGEKLLFAAGTMPD